MRQFVAAAFAIALAACSPPPAAPPIDQAPAVEPPPEIVAEGGSSQSYEDAMVEGLGVWTRRSGNCVLTMDFLPATDGAFVRRESRSNEPMEIRVSVAPNATRVEGVNEMRWPTPDGEARFVWEGEYATLLVGQRRCEYSRFVVRSERPATLP